MYMRIKSFLLSIVFAGLLCGCSSDQQDADKAKDDSFNLVTQFKNLAQDNTDQDNYVVFDLTIDKQEQIAITQTGTVEKTPHSTAFLGLRKKQSSIVIQMPVIGKATITVCCTTDGDEYECETCPDGAGQNLCIIRAINSCTDNGGCAVVCENKMYFDPRKKEFFILK